MSRHLNGTREPASQTETASGSSEESPFRPHPKPLPNDRELLREILGEAKRFIRWADRFVDAHRQLLEVVRLGEDGRVHLMKNRTAAIIATRYEESKAEFCPNIEWVVFDYLTLNEEEFSQLIIACLMIMAAPPSGSSDNEIPSNKDSLACSNNLALAADKLASQFRRLAYDVHSKLASLERSDGVTAETRETTRPAVLSVKVDQPLPGPIEEETVSPVWDRTQRSLSYKGQPCRTYTREAKRQFQLLDAFQEERWPHVLRQNPFTISATMNYCYRL